jgi:hypothetical protein
VIIPANSIADFIPEGNETLKIYIGNSCAAAFSDSIIIEIRDVGLFLSYQYSYSAILCSGGRRIFALGH